MMKPGIYPNLSNESYHADKAISRSAVMKFLQSPHKYWAEYLDPDRQRKALNGTSSALIFGNAFHTFVLEPEKFVEQFAIKPEPVLLKDVGREAYDSNKKLIAELEASTRTLITATEYHILKSMYASLWNNREARGLIEGAVYESSYFWQDDQTGLIVKSRPDILRENAIIDLKTCHSADTRTYQKEMYQYGYYIQGAMIREGVKQLTGQDIPTVVNICVEKTYPFEVGIKIISEEALDAGHHKFKSALLSLNQSIKEDVWTGYDPEVVSLPRWAE